MSRVDDIINGVKKNGTEKKKSRVEDIIEKSSNGNIDTGVDEKYINSFIKDANDYFTNFSNDYKNVGYNNASLLYENYSSKSSELGSRANTIRAFLNSNRNKLDEDTYKQLTSTLDKFDKSRKTAFDSARKTSEYYSQWESEEDYNKAVEDGKKLEKWADPKYLEDLNFQSQAYSNIIGTYNGWDTRKAGTLNESATKESGVITYYTKEDEDASIKERDEWFAQATKQNFGKAYTYEEFKNTLGGISAEYTQAKRYNEGLKLHSEAVGATDFGSFSLPDSTATDETYKYINDINGFRQTAADDFNDYYETSVGFSSGDSGLVGIGAMQQMPSYLDSNYEYMTDEEIGVYNYYYSKFGKEKANEYLDILQQVLNTRSAMKIREGNDTTFERLFFGIEAGFDQFGSGVKNLFNTSDDYITPSDTQIASGMIREDLADTGFNILGHSAGQMGYDLITTTSNMLPSILTSTVIGFINPTAGAAIGAGLLGASAAGNAYAEALNLGFDKGQARMYSALVGTSEATLQYFLGGIGKLGGKLSTKALAKYINNLDNAFARVSLKLGTNMGMEFTEEYLQEVLNPYFKNLSLGTNEDIRLFSSEALYAGILGALSAGVLEGGSTISADVQTTNLGKKMQKVDGGVERLKTLGTTFSADTVAYQIADKVTAETGAHKIGLLLQEVGATLSEQNVSDIVIELTKRGVSEADAKKLARTYQAFLNKEMTLSDEQIATLENCDPLTDVLRTTIIGQDTAIYHRTREYADLVKLATEMESAPTTATPEAVETPSPTVAPYSTEHFDSVVKEFEAMGMPTEHAKIMAEKKLSATASENTSSKEANLAESEFEVSAEGKTINTKTGDVVNIKKIDSISESGEANLTIDDGMVVKASDLTYGSDAEALLIENIGKIKLGKKSISTASANALYQMAKTSITPDMKPSEVASFIKGLAESYVYGAYNLGRSKLSAKNEDGSAIMFAGELTQEQRKIAYELGTQDRVSEVERDQKVIDDLKAKGKPSKKSLGKVIFEDGANVDESTLTATQKANLEGIKLLAEISSVEFHVFKSEKVGNTFRYTAPDGTVNSANGWFVAGTNEIWVDLNAGNAGEGTMIRTAAHEISHYIKQWSPKKWQAMADLLMEEFAKNDVDTESMLERQKAKIKKRYRFNKKAMPSEAKLLDMAYEELVCDAMQDMLTDGSIVNFIAEVKAKDRNLAQKIMDAIKSLLTKWGLIIEDSKGRSLDTAEAAALSQFEDTFKKLQSMYQEAFIDANETVAAIGANETVLTESGISVDSDTDAGSIFSVRDLLDDSQREKVAKALATRFDVTKEEAMQWLTAETSLASLILNPKYSQYLDYTADASEEAIKSNSDYPQGTVDFSNICKKRRDFTEVMNRVLRNFPNHVFMATDLAKIRSIMEEENMEVACAICYVEDRRQLDSIVAQDFIDSLALYREGSKTRPDGKPFNTNQLKALQLIDGDTYTPSIYELISLEGRNSLKDKNPAMNEAWVKFNNARGMQSVRLLLNDAEYKRQILKYNKKTVQSKNDHGGLRIYSFSDMEMFHLIDIIQVITDSAAVGLSLQGYTKVNEYAKAVKDTGEKLNRSLIPKGDLGYHIEDGKVILDFDTVEGIDINHKDFFDSTDNPNVGNIVIGINKKQIQAAMVSKFIDQIIPFHTGQSKEVLGEKGIASWNNYKDAQTEKDLATGNTAKHQINIYTEVFQAAEKAGKPITNKVDFVNKFLEVCKENNLEPRFSEFLNTDENGNYVYTEGYHKFLVDFKTFDQNTGEYLPQMPVKPIFENEYITSLLKDYVKAQKTKDAQLASTMPKVLERITNEVVNTTNTPFENKGETMLSERGLAPTFYSQMGKIISEMKQDKIGAASVVSYLTDSKRGVKAEEIKWSGIETFLEGKKSVTKQELLDFVNNSMLQVEEKVLDGSQKAKLDVKKIGFNKIGAYVNGELFRTYTKNKNGMYVTESMPSKEFFDKEHIENSLKTYVKQNFTNETRFNVHTLDGGTNYRELLFNLPNATHSNTAMQNHWGKSAQGILAHARIQDFDVDGKNMLFIEEIQSDWHNEGQKEGYIKEGQRMVDEIRNESADAYREFYESDVMKSIESRLDRSGYGHAPTLFADLIDGDTTAFATLNEYVGKLSTEEMSFIKDAIAKEKARQKELESAPSPKAVPDAPFKDNYHEFVLKRMLRMAAEQGYDSIGWTPAEVQVERWSDEFIQAYTNLYDKKMRGFLERYGKKWGAKVGTSVLPNGTEVWSMDITDSMKDSVLYEGQAMYSERDTDSSNRGILANALESVAQNDVERKKLIEYKTKISKLNADEKRLAEIQKQLFTKGGVEPSQRKDLQFEAKQIANRINTYDRQLLNLEATTALKNVLNREKALAMKRQKQKDALLRQKDKERFAKTTQKLMARNQESRKKAMENRLKTAMRHKIQNVASELNTLLLNGNKKKHVPEELKVAVADVMELFNMDTVGAEERINKLTEELMKAKDPDKITEIVRKIDHIREMDSRFDAKLSKFKAGYDAIKASADPEISSGFDDVVSNTIASVAQKVGKTPLRYMTLEQLEDVYDVYKMVLTYIRDSNNLFMKHRSETTHSYASRVVGEIRMVGGEHEFTSPYTEGVKTFLWNNLKPIYAMEKIGSAHLTELYNDVRKGEDTWAVDVTEAKEFSDSVREKYGYDEWDFKKKYTFKSSTGEQFTLTLEQMLSLYAFSKRQQADDHLRIGGFVFDDSITTYKETEKNGKKKRSLLKYKVNIASAHQISKDTLADIVSELDKTPGAIKFVDEMQAYLSDVMGAKGNEVSMTLYNVRLFKEKFYFPLKSAKQFMFEKNEVAGEIKLKNSGFTESTQEHANNPIILSNFMDVWANHINDMAMYHSFVVPLENFNRVFNYQTGRKEGMPPVSIKETLQNAYGNPAVEYIRQLLKDLNGGAVSDPRETFSKALVSKFKKAAVMASLSVVVQQPTALVRAMALVDMKHFGIAPISRGIVRTVIPKKHKALWAEVKKYAPVAIIKEMGRFDTHMGQSVQDFIKSEDYKGLKKVKGLVTDSNYRDDVLSKLPALADEMAWVAIWEAVKRETMSKHKDLKPNSEEFLKVVGERFTDVVTKTQVYDSVLARSANMRAKSAFMDMWTSFMAEPTTSINMLEDALRQGKRGNKKYAAKAIGAVYGSVILNAALVSVIYAMRDDDEDETFLEKYASRLTTELLDGLNPLTYIPFVKDVWSIAQGFDIERADMSLLADLVDTLQQTVKVISKDTEDMDEEELSEHQNEVAGALWGIADSISSLVGLPTKNIRRDINGAINLFNTLSKDSKGRKTSVGSLLDEVWEDVKSSIPVVGWLPNETKGDKLYDAIVSGDTAYVDRLKSGYKDDKAYETAVRSALRENDSRIREAAEARIDGDVAEYSRIVKAIKAEGFFSQDTIVAAVNAEINALRKDDNSDSSSDSNKVKSMYNIDDYFMALDGGDEATAYLVKEDLIKTDVANGKDREDAEDAFNGKFASYLREQYEEGSISDSEAQRMLVNYGDKTEKEATSKVQYWAFKQEYPDYDDLSEEAVAKYYNEVEPYGITVDVYYDYSKQRSKCKGVDANGDGKTDSGSVKSEVLWVIHSLPLTYAQKDALYYLNGWSAKTIYEAPWH